MVDFTNEDYVDSVLENGGVIDFGTTEKYDVFDINRWYSY